MAQGRPAGEGGGLARLLHGIALAAVVACALVLVACATPQVGHHFSYDVFADSPDEQVLDFRYGPLRPPEWYYNDPRAMESAMQARLAVVDMGPPDSLYVKWRVKSTGAVFERTVDLRGKLPRKVYGYGLHFIVRGDQLLVYLLTPQPRPAGEPIVGPRRYGNLKVIQLAP